MIKKYKSSFLLLLLQLLLILQINAEYQEPVKFITNFSQLQPIVQGQLDHTATIAFDHPECSRCSQLEEPLQEYAEENQGFTITYIVDCEQMWEDEMAQQSLPMCNPTHISQLPIILLFEPASTTYRSAQNMQQHPYQGAFSQRDLSKFLRKHMPVYRDQIKSQKDFDNFMDIQEFETKVILFTNKENTSPLYKAITSTFRDRILFGEVHESSSDLISQFNINEFPTLYYFTKQQDGTYKPNLYEGRLKYKQIQEFLQEYASENRITKRTKKSQQNSNQKQSKNDKKEEALPEVKQLEIAKFEKQILNKENPILVHVTNQEKAHPLWNEILKKYNNMFEYFSFDANSEENLEFAKNHLFAKQTPAIRFYPHGIYKKQNSKIQFSDKITEIKEINQEFKEQFPDHTIIVSDDQQLQMQYQAQLMAGKVVHILFTDRETPLTIKSFAIDENYNKQNAFIVYRNPSEQMKAQFQIQKYPKFVTLFKESDVQQQGTVNQSEPQAQDQAKVAEYPGKLNYKDLSDYLKIFIQMQEGFQSKREVVEIKSQEDFKKYCQGQLQCLIAILNGEPDQRNFDEDTKLAEQLKILKKLNDRYSSKSVQFAWIDAICHSEILFPLNLSDQEIPNFIAWSESKKAISKMIGRFDREALILFIDKVLKGHVSFQPINYNDFEIKNYDCVVQHQKLLERKQQQEQNQGTGSELEDELLKEILEEERLKREALEKEFEEESGSKKKRKKKKKNKKTDL
ncbi:Thioredoxin-like fold [Pseudocohnilembus persalinus]|uniref:Thioredoxin-like fold n=1 Tax=Pseudocohnilembus persalinus TaxID=266149 RepID=A0A0V0QWF4_PSEPJ|nr:Thioredoxin-like fold [Pseudocohnilembus persalinus]|eukprot:KRX06280.1 Thioredoxin-like fold [Pseudocohnilembus persalinus]